MDEATSAVDNNTDNLIQVSWNRKKKFERQFSKIGAR